jgi:hypothetical protein
MNILSILKAAAKDVLPGGKADNMPDADFDKKKLEHAKKHEMEHTSNPAIAKEVAKDHLLEDSNYYKKIEKIEKLSKLMKAATVRTTMGHESNANVTTPAAEDAAFLSSKPTAPVKPPLEPKKFKKGQSNFGIRNAVIKATESATGINPSLKQGSWREALNRLKELGIN